MHALGLWRPLPGHRAGDSYYRACRRLELGLLGRYRCLLARLDLVIECEDRGARFFLRRALLTLARASRPRAKRCRRTAMSALLAATLRLRRWPRLSRAELCAAAAPSPPAFDEVLRCGTERCAACRPIGSGRRCSSCVTPSMVQRHCVTPARRSSRSWARVHGSDWTAADILCHATPLQV